MMGCNGNGPAGARHTSGPGPQSLEVTVDEHTISPAGDPFHAAPHHDDSRRFGNATREENMTEAAKLWRPEEERMLRWLLRRADALNIAYMAVELEEWGYPEAKEEMLALLDEMRVEA